MKKITNITIFALISIIFTLSLDPIAQPQNYHNFADHRSILGISNFLNVLTNISFLIIGLIGLIKIRSIKKHSKLCWSCFYLGIIMVAPGSTYYHLIPNNFTLVWDRLPMTVAFMSLLVAVLNDFVWDQAEKKLLIPSVLLGLFSVLYWYYTETKGAGDLRLYFWVQGFPLFIISPVLIMMTKDWKTRAPFIVALAFYLLAKFSEILDIEIFTITGQMISGHSIKHLLASLSPFALLSYIKNNHSIESAT